jgi:ferredoxin
LDPRTGLEALVGALADAGYRVLGPVVRDGVIAYDDIATADEMPIGWTVEQRAGSWRLRHDGGATRFDWTPGADSWKRFVYPAHQEVLRIRRRDGSWIATRPAPPDRPLAIIGARDCEVRALDVLDAVLLGPDHPDPRYAQRRAGTFVVAVTCGVPAATCWCTSMGGGPRPHQGFDVRLTELDDADGHRLLAEAGSERGAAVLAGLPADAASEIDHFAAGRVVERAAEQMPARVPGAELPVLLEGTDLHPQWEQVARRCLSCGNCTMVCPTCFCSTIDDTTALTPDGSGAAETVRQQHWLSCFQLDHSNLAGRPVRATTAARYRQWLTHKLQTWPEQFGTAGCVGCGRCTTWCPAAIDIVQEVAVLIGTASDGRPS